MFGDKTFNDFLPTAQWAEVQNGVFIAPASGVKIVFPKDDTRLHAFPITAQPGSINYCANCGAPLPMW